MWRKPSSQSMPLVLVGARWGHMDIIIIIIMKTYIYNEIFAMWFMYYTFLVHFVKRFFFFFNTQKAIITIGCVTRNYNDVKSLFILLICVSNSIGRRRSVTFQQYLTEPH